MFKRILSIVLAVALLSVSVFAAEPVAEGVYEGYTEDYASNEEKPSDTSYDDSVTAMPTPMPVLVTATSTQAVAMETPSPLMPGIWYEPPVFDDVIDQLFFNQFREGFEVIRRHSVPINRTIRHGSFTMEVLTSVAIAGRTHTMLSWPQDITIDFNEETGEIIFPDIPEEDMIQTTWSTVNVHTFFSLHDASGVFDMTNWGTILGMAEDRERMIREDVNPMLFGHINFTWFDSETDTAYFVAHHSTSFEGEMMDSISVDFAIDRIMADQRNIEEDIAFDFAGLLASHNATFFTNEVDDTDTHARHRHIDSIRAGGPFDSRLFEIMGEDFNPFAPEAERMNLNELNMQIFEGHYLTNIAVRDNLLLLQVSTPAVMDHRWPMERWSSISLIDSRVERLDWDAIFASFDWDNFDWDNFNWETDVHPLEELLRRQESRVIPELYSLDVTPRNWETFNVIGDMHVREIAFFIEDMNTINHLAFAVSGTYYSQVGNINLRVPTFNVPILYQQISVADSFQVEILDTLYTIRDIHISTTEIQFVIDDADPLFEQLMDFERFISVSDMIQLELIHRDGTVSESTSFGHWSSTHSMPMPPVSAPILGRNDRGDLIELRIHFSSNVFDVENLAAIRINGVRVDVR